MRKRWDFNPFPFVCAWAVGGGAATALTAILTDPPCKRSICPSGERISTATHIAMWIWLGPLMAPIVGAAIVFGTIVLWEARPRRVSQPVHEDLREVWKPNA